MPIAERNRARLASNMPAEGAKQDCNVEAARHGLAGMPDHSLQQSVSSRLALPLGLAIVRGGCSHPSLEGPAEGALLGKPCEERDLSQ